MPVTTFRGRPLPIPAHLAGYSALIDRHALPVPLHYEMAAVSPKTLRHREGGWKVLPSSLRPGESDVEQLIFALKHEGIQLLTLKKVFEAFEPMELVEAALAKPTSGYLRRLCHLYEWLLERRLDVPDAAAGSYVDLVDATQQYGTTSKPKVRRFRVVHNLPARAPSVRSFSGRTGSTCSSRAISLAKPARSSTAHRASSSRALQPSCS